jgi:SAM-dependent methyltransferase
LLSEAQSSTVVDVGCGEAALLRTALVDGAMASLTHAIGVDISPTALARGCRAVTTALLQRADDSAMAAATVPSVWLYSVRIDR